MKNNYILKGLLVFVLFAHANLIFAQNKITSFPYSESFETGTADWIQSTDDVFDWSWNSGTTGSSGTGPNAAHDGTYYIYTEASNDFLSETYIDASFDFTGLTKPAFSFYYHMFGSNMGSLHIDVWDGTWNLDEQVITGQQQTANDSPWENTIVDLTNFAGSDSVVVRLRGLTGSSFESDICIDKIEVIEGTDMTYTSSTVSHTNTTNVYQNSTNNNIALIEVTTDGLISALEINAFEINSNGSDNFALDVENVSIYYTGTSNTFSTSDLFGSSADLSAPITGTVNLSTGPNYFWITYDIAADATPENIVDVECTTISFTGITGDQVPTITNPTGSRSIYPAIMYVSSTLSQSLTTNVNQNSVDNVIALMEVVTDGTSDSLKISAFDLNANGSDNFALDVDNVSIYYTGTSNTFSTSDLFGSSTDLSAPIAGSVKASTGTNYFWITYDIAADATPENIVDVECTTISFAGTTGDQIPTVTNPTGSRTIDPEMTVDTAYCFSITEEVEVGSSNEAIIGLNIITENYSNTLNLESIDANSTGTDNYSQDITKAKIYATNSDSEFNTDTLIWEGDDFSSPISIDYNLTTGDNYFWITYDISESATINNVVDAQCTSLTIDGQEYLPGNTSPIGNRKIKVKSLYSNFMSASIVVGQTDFISTSTSLNEYNAPGPNNSAVSAKGVLAVGSQSYGRILIWNSIPDSNGTAADIVLGSPSFYSSNEGPTASYMDNVEGVCFSPDGEKLIASDGNGHRVLIWNTIPTTNGQPADVVIGQTDFTSKSSGNGPDELNYPGGVIVTPDGKLIITELGNSRVLIFNTIPEQNGASADVVIGQDNFNTSGSGTQDNKLNGPWNSAVSPEGKLVIADRTNNRVLVYNSIPTQNGQSADVVIGQYNFTSNSAGTSKNTLSTPIGVTVSPKGELAIGEYNNNRVLIYNEIPTENGASADIVLGQPNFNSADDWNGGISDKSMYHPYGINFDLNGRLYVNGRDMHRVMIFGDIPENKADVQISIVPDKYAVNINDEITYTYTLTNNGPSQTSNVVVKCALPALFNLDSYTAEEGEFLPYGGSWKISQLSAGKSITLELTGTVIEGNANIKTYAKIVASDAFDADLSNNAMSVKVLVSNETPTISGFTPDTIDQGSLIRKNFTIADSDTDISDLTVSVISSDPLLVDESNISLIGSDETWILEVQSESDTSGTVYITVQVSDGYTTAESTLLLEIESTNNNLSDILINSVSLVGFDASTYSYSYELASGVTDIPVVTATIEHADAVFEIYETDTLAGVTTITVTAENGAQKNYYINFFNTILASTDATIDNISIDGETIEGFAPFVYEYDIVLPFGTTTVPSPSYSTTNASASDEIEQTISLPGSDIITVTAEDLVTTQEYILNYLLDSGSDNTNLFSLTIDSEQLPTFHEDTLNYTIELPFGTTTMPYINGSTGSNGGTAYFTQATTLPGVAVADVIAENGINNKPYTVNFTLAPASDDATLSELLINGSPFFDFDPNITSYNILLEKDSSLPILSAEANHNSATLVVTDASTIPGTGTVAVTAQNSSKLTYNVNFDFEPLGNNADLISLNVNGKIVDGFAKDVFTYDVELPMGTVDMPTVTASVYDGNAKYSITNVTTLPSSAIVTITSEDISVTNVYTVNFTVAPNNDASLSDLLSDGFTVVGFDPTVYVYNIELAQGTTIVPTVTYFETDANASGSITDASSLPGTTTVKITAEDGVTSIEYLINYSVAVAAGTDASLFDLLVDGETISGFASFVYDYAYELPFGTTTVPTVTYTLNDGLATPTLTNAASVPGTSSVKVTAQNTTTELTYNINFTIAPASSNADLSDIQVDGLSISEFNANGTAYFVELAYGTTTVPAVTADKDHYGASITSITDATQVPGITTITVTAEDATTTKSYTVEFTHADPNNDAYLDSLIVDGVLLSTFNTNIFSYNIELTEGTTVVPTITEATVDTNAIANVTAATSLPGTTTIEVTAEDGSTILTYNVNFTVKQEFGKDATLSNIIVNGSSIQDFVSSNIEYSVYIPGCSTIPVEVTGITNDASANTTVTYPVSYPGQVEIEVVSLDLTETITYLVNILASNDSTLSDLLVDGTTVTNFASTTHTYNVELAYRTEDVPSVTATKNDPYASVEITEATSLPGQTTVKVIAEDDISNLTYEVNFTKADSTTDATLSDLLVDGTTVEDFVYTTHTYNVKLAYGTTDIPVVTATKYTKSAMVVITDATSLPGQATVEVTAEDGVTVITYSVNFTTSTLSTDATLSDLLVDGITVGGFNSTTHSYNVELDNGTTIIPVVTATKNDANASMVITDASSTPGQATVEVIAEDGVSSITYTIDFTFATSINDLSFENNVNLYPNPSNGIINIEFNNALNDECQLEIYNSIGTLIYSNKVTSTNNLKYEINLGGFPKGMYFVKIFDKNDSATKNVIIQ